MFGKKPVTEDHLEHDHEVSTSHAAIVNAKPTLLNYVAAIFAWVMAAKQLRKADRTEQLVLFSLDMTQGSSPRLFLQNTINSK